METVSGPRIYNLFPLLVGPVNAWRQHLLRVAAMGFDWVYLNPFHYPGFSGSLYAVKDPMRLNPLFEDAPGTDPAVALAGFVAEAERRGLGVMMDWVINHTSKDSILAADHPEWFRHEADGSLYSPRALDVDDPDDPAKATVWGDLAEIDYSERPGRHPLVGYWKELLRHYIGLGIRGFRCDAAYKVPAEVWAELIAAARESGRPLLFAAETLGCRTEEVEALGRAGFDCLFNSSKWWDFRAPWLLEQYEAFRRIAPSISFPESHDTPRLITEIPPDVEPERIYRQRYLLAAAFATGVMMPIGYEFGFAKPLDVVATRPHDWESPRFDLSDFIGAVNRMKAEIKVLNWEGPQRLVRFEGEATIGLVRGADHDDLWCLALINTDPYRAHTAWLDEVEGLDPRGGSEVTPGRPAAPLSPDAAIGLGPAEVRVFTRN